MNDAHPAEAPEAAVPRADLTSEEKALAWMLAYANLHRPLGLRLVFWLPTVVILAGILIGGPALTGAAVIALGCFATEAIWSVSHVRRYRPMLPVFIDLARFPDSTDRERVETMILILNEAHPALRALRQPTGAQVREAVANSALRLLVIADAEGCGAGHTPICRHRRDNDSWMRWIEQVEGGEEDEPVTFHDATDQIRAALTDPRVATSVQTVRAEMDEANREAKS